MSGLLQCAESEIGNRRLFSRGQKILVAVSGGVDSMVLLHVLHSLAVKNGWKIIVAHFNHRLRGLASDADEKLVRETAKKLRLKFVGESADVKKFAAQSKLSIEMAARKLRHEFLARVAAREKIKTIALAHHADDQVELFFLRLFRGAGGEGLAGMKWRSPSPVNQDIFLVRPLLAFSKTDIAEFGHKNKVHYREDETNFSTDFLRNRIRKQLLPLLMLNYQPAVKETVLRVMDIIGAEAEAVSADAKLWLKQGKNLPGFAKLSVAVQRKVLRERLVEQGIWADFELVEQLRESSDRFIDFFTNKSVARNVDGDITVRDHTLGKFNPATKEVEFSDAMGMVDFSHNAYWWRMQPPFTNARNVLQKKASQVEHFDADKIGDRIVLRHWRPGDRFQPIGMKRAVKLQDLFVNAKIPAARRRELVLAEAASGEIFWVEGLRIGDNFKLTPETKRKLIWERSKIAG